MVCYLVRHGKDDDSARGGWSPHPLTAEGVAQVKMLADYIFEHNDSLGIKHIYTSDLARAKQTARIIGSKIDVSVTKMPEFREVNNGALAGMKNELANIRYPGLYWNTLAWDEAYPDGESPKVFYKRISAAWARLEREMISGQGNTMLVTHGGVINVILSIVNRQSYSNKKQPRQILNAQMIALEFIDGNWIEKKPTE